MSEPARDWFYIDDDGNEQGPYAHDNICAWFRDAYFDGDTNVRHADADAPTKLSATAAFVELFDDDDDDDDGESTSSEKAQLKPLVLDGVEVPPPPGWTGEPIVSNEQAVQQATAEIAAMLAAARDAAASASASAAVSDGKWSDAEFEYWSAMAQRAMATPQALPTAVWQQLERERRERQRIAAAAAKYIKDHQTRGIKRKKYSWSSGFKDVP
jgi:hypothetical protein